MESQSQKIWCTNCNKYFRTAYYQHHLTTKVHQQNVALGVLYKQDNDPNEQDSDNPFTVEQAFQDENSYNIKIVSSFKKGTSLKLNKHTQGKNIDAVGFKRILMHYYDKYRQPFKYYMGVKVRYTSPTQTDDDGNSLTMVRSYTSKSVLILNPRTNKISLRDQLTHLTNRMEEEELQGSGWEIEDVEEVTLGVHLIKHTVSGSYIKLPFKSNVILNIQNTNDDYCLIWSLLAFLHPISTAQHPCRTKSYAQWFDDINIEGIDFPISLKGIKQFSKQNSDIRFSVYELEYNKATQTKTVNPLFTPHIKDCCIILLYQSHFVLCKNLSVFLNHTKSHSRMFTCYKCLVNFSSQQVLDNHQQQCVLLKETRAVFHKDEYKYFNEHRFKNKVPFVLYGDFEAYNLKTDEETTQQALSWGVQLVSNYQDLVSDKYYSYLDGEDCIQAFVKLMKHLDKKLYNCLQTNYKLDMSVEQKRQFKVSTNCYYCGCEFDDDTGKVRDHDHFQEKANFRGASCTSCNAKDKRCNFVPIYFHNASGYDNHLMFVELMTNNPKQDCKILANTEEKYISFEFGCLRFLDSYRLLSEPLDSLASYIEPKKLHILHSHDDVCKNENRKGIFPYDYLTGTCYEDIFDKLCEESLPPKEAFYSKLKQENISDKDYNQALVNWDLMECIDLCDYTIKYMKIDVCLLADVFENFRNTCLNEYQIDPCYCYSTPGLTWLAGLKFTKVKLKYYKESTFDQELFFEEGVRGGTSGVYGDRDVKVHNEYTDKKSEFLNILGLNKLNPEPQNYLYYLDANSLYPTAMVQELPTGEMEWSDDLTYTRTKLGRKNPGYVYQVDLKYPKELHDKTQYYPFCPEKLQVPDNWLSEWQSSNKNEKFKSSVKLIQTTHDKMNYIIEGRMLDWVLSQGMSILKIHKKLVYKKSAWLKSYIEYNIEKRSQCPKGTFENYFYKLMNNAFYGKTLENVRNRQEIKVVNSKEKAMFYAAKLGFVRSTHFSPNVEAIHLKKSFIKFDKFNYIGSTILELSKLTMYKFIYEGLYEAYGDKFKIHGGDTDSIFVELIDSDLEKVSQYIDDTKLGFFSNELKKGQILTEYIILKSKMYSYKIKNIVTGEISESKRCKGIPKSSAKGIRFENYYDCLLGKKQPKVSTWKLASQKHAIQLLNQTKESINSYDDKRYIFPDGIHTLPFGHYKIL